MTSTQDAIKQNCGIGQCQRETVMNVGLPEMSQGWHGNCQGLELVKSFLPDVSS